jgi:hypothetical protein
MIEAKDLIRILRQVPEARLHILELCGELITEEGTIDGEKVAFYSHELIEATKEAEQYSRETQAAVRCLRELGRWV